MDKATCLSKMILPSMKRPGAYKNGIIQVFVCRACDQKCTGCTQNSQLKGPGNYISVEGFETAVRSLKGYFGVVGMFGGNPCMHPRFADLCAILRNEIPKERRGLWSNRVFGHGKTCRETFNPAVCNLNVHLSKIAYDEMKADWPECNPVGLSTDSRHAPPFISMVDLGIDENQKWEKISKCTVNQNWSAMVCEIDSVVQGFFCEIAASQAMMLGIDDSGIVVDPNADKQWWELGLNEGEDQTFADQIESYCQHCSVPLDLKGDLAVGGRTETVSEGYRELFEGKMKDSSRELVVIEEINDPRMVASYGRLVDYIKNAK